MSFRRGLLLKDVEDAHARPQEDYCIKEFVVRSYPYLQRTFNALSEAHKKELSSVGGDLAKMRTLFVNSDAPWNKGLALMKEISALRHFSTKESSNKEYEEAFENLVTKYCRDPDPEKQFSNVASCLVNLNWCYLMLAAEQGKAYTQGSLRIQDTGRAPLRHFAVALMTFQEDFRAVRNGRRASQIRIASHLTHIKTLVYGIDIPASLRSNKHFDMPNRALHSFVKQIDDEWLLFKPEDHGTTNYTDLVEHTVGFIHSQQRAWFGGNESEGFQKERVPAWATKLVGKLIATALPDDGGIEGLLSYVPFAAAADSKVSRTAVYTKTFSEQGLQVIAALVRELEAGGNPLCAEQPYIKAKEELFARLKPYGCLKGRFGNEVELTYEQIESYAPPYRGYEI